MPEILVTGGTGNLGRPTVARLRAAGHSVRILTRGTGAAPVQSRAHPHHLHREQLNRGDLVHGDLVSGAGIDAALDGVGTVIHLATQGGKRDVLAIHKLTTAAERAGVRHLIVMSIVGIEQIPLGYYLVKREVESLARQSSVPHTILRSTQFHSLVERIFGAQRWSPVVFAPTFSFQPIAVDDVAVRLSELCMGDAVGRVPDIGGPERRTASDLARSWARAAGVRRPIWPLTLPGDTSEGFAAGHNLVPGNPYGTATFENYLAAKYGTAVTEHPANG